MGSGRWESTGRSYYRSSSSRARSTTNVREVFRATTIADALNPNGVMLRESCDSDHNPKSNAIIIGLDVTGSMGFIAYEIAKEGLGTLIEGILERKPVSDPHILVAAIGDVRTDRAPLQISQFEADDRIVKQLEELYIEGNGGGNNTESYDLPWYFAGTKTAIDCYTKRKQKGYLFTVGDEMPPVGLSQRHIEKVFGVSDETGYTPAELLRMAEEKYHVFHIIVEQGHYVQRTGRDRVVGAWRELMGKRAIPLDNYTNLPEVALAAMELSEGADLESVIESRQTESSKNSIRHAFARDQW